MANYKKCSCTKNNKIFCPNCSKIRMVILLKNGNDHLKINGYNPVWYSILKYNTYDIHSIVEKMLRRFKTNPLSQQANVVQFYINGNRSHAIHKVTL